MKCDVAAIVSKPTKNENTKLEKILKSSVALGKKPPNICMSIYKNRGGKYNNVKIWLYIDYATMRVSDQFVTDYEFNILPIEQNYVHVTEDNKIHIFTDKESVKKFQDEIAKEMAEISEDEVEETESDSENQKRLQEHIVNNTPSALLNKTIKTSKLDVDEEDFIYD